MYLSVRRAVLKIDIMHVSSYLYSINEVVVHDIRTRIVLYTLILVFAIYTYSGSEISLLFDNS